MGATGGGTATATPDPSSVNATNVASASVLDVSIRAVTGSKTGVTVAVRRGAVCVA